MRTPVAIALLLTLGACGGGSAEDALEGSTELDLTPCDPAGGVFSLDITNQYLPFQSGQSWLLTNDDHSESVRITVLDDIEVVAGIETRVVEEREWVDGDLVEVSRNYVVQADDGSVCYFGEKVDDYADGEIVGHGGSWLAGVDGNLPGILMPGQPEVGTSFAQEVAPGVAEDTSVIIAIGQPYTVPAGTFDDTLESRDVDPLGGGVDEKRYARDVGLIVDEKLTLVEFTTAR